MITLTIPEALAALVERALAREGLAVSEVSTGKGFRPYFTVTLGQPVPDVPRLIAHDGPELPASMTA